MQDSKPRTVLDFYNLSSRPFVDVNHFMMACGQLHSDLISRSFNPDSLEAHLYLFSKDKNMITEEYRELQDAISFYLTERNDENLAAILDALFDLQWVVIAATLCIGVPVALFWRVGAESNLSKIDQKTGLVLKRKEDGKILKPEGWRRPDFLSIIEAHRERQERSNALGNPRTVNASPDADSATK